MTTTPPSPHGPPRVHLAAVGDLMCETVGEVADGIVLHSFNTPRYLKSRIIPAVERGCARAHRSLADVDFCATVLVVTGADDAAMARADVATRERIAFYGSTPDYRGVFDAHGWGHLQDELHELSRARDWAKMSTLVTDEVLDTFAVVGRPDEVGRRVKERYGGLAQRVAFATPYDLDRDTLGQAVAGFA